MQKNDLLKLNLEEYEVDIYWNLLMSGKQSVYKLAKDLKIPRSTMYGYVSNLISKGFLVWSNTKKDIKYVEAVHPENVKRVYELEKQKIGEYETILSNLGVFLKENEDQSMQMNIKYYEGVGGLEQIIWNTLSCKSGNMYGLSDWDRNKNLSQAFIDLHCKEAVKRGPTDHIIIKKERVEEVKYYVKVYPLEFRVIDSQMLDIHGDTYIYDNVFAATIVSGDKIFGVEIENDMFAKIQLSMFMLLWNMAEVVA